MASIAKRHMHRDLLRIAEKLTHQHFVEYDGARCFNICTYLIALESAIDGAIYDGTNGPFELSAHSVSRYIWACLAMSQGESPYGDTYKGAPLLD